MITIKQISITDLNTDAIVNAANEHLQAGGGVCGAIFSAAGHKRLQAACDEIKHCDTGSAVITSGFDLKAKFIIHAVGPIWRGGNNGESKALYNAYKRSLELAAENGCHSIGFPLISAGIFGYPLEGAWRKAIQASMDFEKSTGHSMEIVFAVLDKRYLISPFITTVAQIVNGLWTSMKVSVKSVRISSETLCLFQEGKTLHSAITTFLLRKSVISNQMSVVSRCHLRFTELIKHGHMQNSPVITMIFLICS